jgi:hypothetical protein
VRRIGIKNTDDLDSNFHSEDGLFALLAGVARRYFGAKFPKTDVELRECVCEALWQRWCERPPAPGTVFDGDVGIERYVCRSLRNAMCSMLRKRARRARVCVERAWELEHVVHSGSVVDDDASDLLERRERAVDVQRTVAFFDDELLPLLAGRRAGRAEAVARLAQERMSIVKGESTFASVVAAESKPGESARTVENRLRQRYGRALDDVLVALAVHAAALVQRGHDPTALKEFARELFSDRAAPSRAGESALPRRRR